MIEPTFKYMSAAQICEVRGCKSSKFYDDIRVGIFPAGERLGANTVRWRSDVVAAWLNEQSLKATEKADELARKVKERCRLGVEANRCKAQQRATAGADHAPA